MPRAQLKIFGGQRQSRSSAVNNQQLQNWYIENEGQDADAQAPAYPFPGLLKKFTAGAGPGRGDGAYWPKTEKNYVVSGSGFYEIESDFTANLVGTLNSANGYVTVTPGVTYIMVIDGTDMYSWDGTTFVQTTGLSFTPGYGMWNDNYFIANDVGTGKWYRSTLDDPTTGNWAMLDFVTAEKRPDNLLRPSWYRGKPLMIGQYTSELYTNTGVADNPFERYPNTIYEYGTPAPNSIAEAKDTIFMLSQTRIGDLNIIKISLTGDGPISTPPLNWQILQGAFTDAEGFAYEQYGHLFYQIAFPAAGRVYTWDDTVGVWTERTTGTARHRARGHLFMINLGVHLVGDYQNGNFYALDKDTYTDNGTFIMRLCSTAPFTTKDRNTFRCNRIEAEFVEGPGNTNAPGNDPVVFIRWSWDGSRTFSNWMTSPLGKKGEYDKVAAVNLCGHGRELTVEVKVTEPIESILEGIWIDFDQGIS